MSTHAPNTLHTNPTTSTPTMTEIADIAAMGDDSSAPVNSSPSKATKNIKPQKSVPRLDLDFIGKLHTADAGSSLRAIDRVIQDRYSSSSGLSQSVIEPVINRSGSQPHEIHDGHELHGAADVQFEVGSMIQVPIAVLAEDPLNAREFYAVEDLDEMSESLTRNGQLAPITAYEKEGRLWVFDGVKRLRAARNASLVSLRVDIRVRPSSDLDIYMTSRRMNLERSTQSALDDAVRWSALLEQQILSSQQALAKLIGKSEGFVSQVLAINRIPRSVLAHMKEKPKTSEQVVAYKLSGIFKPELIQEHGEETLVRLSKEIINEIAEKDLNRQDVDRLIERRLGAPKQRARAEQQKFKCLGKDGMFKTFPSKGKIEFTISGLDPAQMELVEAALRGLKAPTP